MNANEMKARIDELSSLRSSIVHFRRIPLERIFDEYHKVVLPIERKLSRLDFIWAARGEIIAQAHASLVILDKECKVLENTVRIVKMLDLMKRLGVEPGKAKQLRKKVRDARRKLAEKRNLMKYWRREIHHQETMSEHVIEEEKSTLRQALEKEDTLLQTRLGWRTPAGYAELERIDAELANLRRIIPDTAEPVKDNEIFQKIKKLKSLMAQVLKLTRGQ